MLSDRGNYGLLCCQNARQLHDEILCYLDNQKLKRQYDIHHHPLHPHTHTLSASPSFHKEGDHFQEAEQDRRRDRVRKREIERQYRQ